MLEVGYLIYQERYFYPGLIVLIFSVAAISLIVTLRRQRRKVMAMVNECRLTPIIWEGWVRAVSSHRLLPGDVLVLQQGKALCDMVVLQGSCLVMESMLSGEVRVSRAQQLSHVSLALAVGLSLVCPLFEVWLTQILISVSPWCHLYGV